MSAPRIDVDLEKIGENAHTLVRLAARLGVSVTGVTKAMLGSADLARTLLAAGVADIGDSRIENIERMRAAGIGGRIVLIRSPMPSQIDRVVDNADVSCNTEIEVVEELSRAARAIGRTHGVILMVELGDLREGIMPDDLPDAVERMLALPGLELHGIGTNLACRSGVVPDAAKMAELSALAALIEVSFGVVVPVVSGGNSANLGWLLGGTDPGRVNNLRLGEAILLGRDPLDRHPIADLHTDAVVISAEVVESKHKPRVAWGRIAQTAFGLAPALIDKPPPSSHEVSWQSILAIGHQDTDPSGLTAPLGIDIVGASSDHLVVHSSTRLPIGSEHTFFPTYGAMLRSMSSTSVTLETHSAPVGPRVPVPRRE